MYNLSVLVKSSKQKHLHSNFFNFLKCRLTTLHTDSWNWNNNKITSKKSHFTIEYLLCNTKHNIWRPTTNIDKKWFMKNISAAEASCLCAQVVNSIDFSFSFPSKIPSNLSSSKLWPKMILCSKHFNFIRKNLETVKTFEVSLRSLNDFKIYVQLKHSFADLKD